MMPEYTPPVLSLSVTVSLRYCFSPLLSLSPSPPNNSMVITVFIFVLIAMRRS